MIQEPSLLTLIKELGFSVHGTTYNLGSTDLRQWPRHIGRYIDVGGLQIYLQEMRLIRKSSGSQNFTAGPPILQRLQNPEFMMPPDVARDLGLWVSGYFILPHRRFLRRTRRVPVAVQILLDCGVLVPQSSDGQTVLLQTFHRLHDEVLKGQFPVVQSLG